VLAAMDELAALARAARQALLARDLDRFAQTVDASFDVRARMLSLDPRHVSMIDCARESGAGANYTGSGGAIVAVCRDAHHRAAVREALTGVGCGSIELPRAGSAPS
jgi:glucuronokinase